MHMYENLFYKLELASFLSNANFVFFKHKKKTTNDTERKLRRNASETINVECALESVWLFSCRSVMNGECLMLERVIHLMAKARQNTGL